MRYFEFVVKPAEFVLIDLEASSAEFAGPAQTIKTGHLVLLAILSFSVLVLSLPEGGPKQMID